jgi:hypothetical protein
MTGWLIFAVYSATWFVAAIRATRLTMTQPRCSGKGKHRWGWDGSSCRRFDPTDCWRARETPGVIDTLIGSTAALAWPVALPILAVRHFAATTTASTPRLMSEADLDRLERDLGIGGGQR